MLLIPSDPDHFRSNNFDAIRLSMAIAVVWSHSFALYRGSEKTEPISIFLNGAYNAGNIGVMVFFVISGFLVTGSYFSSKSLKKFMGRRIRRIYPGYLAATSICAFVVIPIYAHVRNLSSWEVIKTISANLVLRNYFPPSNVFTANPFANAVNGSLWSIPYEFWCYIGVAVLGLLGLLVRRWLLVSVTIVVLLVRVGLDVLDKKPGGGIIGLVIGELYLWFVILPNFLFGMLAYAFQNVIPRSRIILVLLFISVLTSTHLSENLTHLIMPAALAYATFYVAFSKSIPLYRAAWWGDFSYGTYLYAFPIQQMLVASFFPGISFVVFIPLAICLSLFAGIMSWYFVERWFVQRHKVLPYSKLVSTSAAHHATTSDG